MSLLFSPLETKNLSLNNRLVFPPMATAKSTDSGEVTEDVLSFYDEKSRGGYFSLFIVEHSFVSQEGKASNNQMSVADPKMLDGLKAVANVIKANNSKAIMQINHAGSCTSEAITGLCPVGPSAVPHPRKETIPNELSKEEIKNIVKAFVDAAMLVKEASFDGVEIHGAHGYLLNQFLSPITNKRTDEYGGDILSRIRLHLEIISAVRNAVGINFPILLRLGTLDYLEGGTTMEDVKLAAIEFEKAGVDILDISGGLRGYNVPELTGQGFFSPITEALKEVISIPVILTGGITEASAAENLLTSGKTDLVGVGRAALVNSLWGKEAFDFLCK